MNKPFLLIAGEDYYPEPGTSNWIGRFKTPEEAIKALPKGFDWYKIVNLET